MATIGLGPEDRAWSSATDLAFINIQHPDEVLESLTLTTAEKRSILASWASDERTVVGDPTLRQLPSGAMVRLHDIQRALLSLDRMHKEPPRHRMEERYGRNRRRLARWLSGHRRRPWDDDDDPPPAPATAARSLRAAVAG